MSNTSIIDIVNSLSETSSRNKKLEIIRSHQSNTTLKEAIRLALDPLVTFGIKAIPPYTASGSKTLEQVLPEFNDLIHRRATGHSAINHLANMLSNVDAGSAKIIERIISKDLKCGVAEATVNAVWPGLIFDFPIMKASPYSETCFDDFQWPAISQEKLDGARCCILVGEGTVTVLSSSGREITTHGQFNWLADICSNQVIDGELLVTEPGTNEFMSRKKGNGIVTKAIRGTIPASDSANLHLVTFDVIPLDKWKEGIYSTDYQTRFNYLNSLALQFQKSASVVESKLVNNAAEASEHFNYMLSRGREGTIVKDLRSIWANERSRLHIKLKDIVSCDLEVIAVEPGTGKYTGMVGSLLCRSADGKIEVSVGSGLSDNDRKNNQYVGKIVEVLFNEKLASKDASKPMSLFLPRLSRVRHDKLVADTIDNIPGATRLE